MDNMTIHKSHYTASMDNLNDVLIVSCNRNGKGGVFLQGDEAVRLRHEIETASDKREADAICRFLVQLNQS